MKKKLGLIITATVLALSLAIGGTLMLFTDTSAVATNTVTLGDLGIDLQEGYTVEDSETEVEYVDWKSIVDDPEGFTGQDFDSVNIIKDGKIEIDKNAKVVHTGGVDAYLRVIATITLKKDGSEVTDTDSDAFKLVSALLAKNTNKDFYFQPDNTTESDLSGIFYYTDDNTAGGEDSTLIPFTQYVMVEEDGVLVPKKDANGNPVKNEATIITAITVDDATLAAIAEKELDVEFEPASKGPNTLHNKFKNVELTIELKAEAVQVANNGYTAGSDWEVAFADFE
jgi:predicted ribosomally synthesized peptide with SipW-like signal peptide